ncbi:MAG: DUF499 domain-containing protein [Anaerolineae bacterium]
MPLKPWYTVVYPREDLRNNRPQDAAEFAVHLDLVHTGQAPDVYQQPQEFFERTFLTKNLTTLATQAIRRLSGIHTETSAVFNLATQFGGGKTHSLTLLYHLAKHGADANRWPGVERLLERAGLNSIPSARTAVFVGQQFDPRGGDDGTPLRRTPWGEIAWQLGDEAGYGLLASFDEQGIAPGGDTLGKLFRLVDQPVLILMDELMNYISRYRQGGLSAQFYNFLQNLSEQARSHDRVVLAVSVPASELEMTAEDAADFERIKKLLERLGKAIMMAAETETSEIIRRRLFEWDPRAVGQNGKVLLNRDALATCEAYAGWVVEHRQQVPSWFPVDNARDMFADTYPFHPLVISVFERKWQTLPRFQRTRGVLRMLAQWVAHAYNSGFQGAFRDPLISLGTAPLEDPFFRAAVFGQLGEDRLEGPVTTDICGRKESHALRLDADATDNTIKKARLHRKVATTIFFESNGGQYAQGVTVPEIRLNVAEPNLDIGHVETVLETMQQTFYYLRLEHSRYRFTLNPELNKWLADRLASVPAAKITERVNTEIGHVFPPGPLERIFFAESSSQVPDRPRLTLIILAPHYGYNEPDTQRLIERITREHGNSGRTYKNALLWVVPEETAKLRDEARKLLAWEDIRDETAGSNQLDTTQQRQLDANIRKSQGNLREAVWRTYRNILLLDKDNTMRRVDLGLIHSSSADSLTSLIVNRLTQDDEVTATLSPNFLARNWPPGATEWSTRAVRDAFFASPQFPRLLNPDAVKETIAKGVANGILGYVGKASGQYHPFYFNQPAYPTEIEISDDMFIISRDTAEAYLKQAVAIEVSPSTVSLKPGETCQFSATGRNRQGQELPLESVQWQVQSGGVIDPGGLFQAGPSAGQFEVVVSSGDLRGSGAVTIVTGPGPAPHLTAIELMPAQAQLKPGERVSLAATGIYSDGSRIPLPDVTWQASGGSIDGSGQFLAGSQPGNFQVSASREGITQSAIVAIEAPAPIRGLRWRGSVPAQKWTNFYMKVLTRFASTQDFELTLNVEIRVTPKEAGKLSDQKIEETRSALRELGLDDDLGTD